jgi:zinc protease
MIGFTGLAEEFETSWAILSERVARPTLDSAAVELVRQQELTSLRAGTENPDQQVGRLAASLAFAGHPYAVEVDGTEQSLSEMGLDEVRAYHDQRFVRSRMLLAVVGPLDREAVQEAIRASALMDLPAGSYEWTLPAPWGSDAPDIVSESRALPTNYIMGYFGGPSTDADDYPAFRVAVSALSGLISGRVRARGLSYAAGAPLLDRAASGGGVYVSAVDPLETMGVINDAIRTIRGGGLDRATLRAYAEDSRLTFYLSNQTSAQQAEFLATSLLLGGRPETVTDWVESLSDISGFDVRRAAEQYIQNIQYGFLGAGQVPRDRMLRY